MNHNELIERLITLAIDEDIAGGDISTLSIIPRQNRATAELIMKADGVISGLDIAKRIFDRFEDVEWYPKAKDGDRVQKGQIVLQVVATYQSLLSAERTVLNFMQRMSGIATATANCVEKLEGTKCKLLDTRKTIPGHRMTDKMAVRHGGGTNHRIGLYDMVMLKDNHIRVAGGIPQAIAAVKVQIPISVLLEVETSNIDEVQQAVDNGADIIMLDNMTNEEMQKAVSLIAGRAKTEASGNMSLERLKDVSQTGVDFISIGAITHSVKALDISMNIIPE